MQNIKNKINIFNILYLLLFLYLAFVCISLCRYYIYGDSQFYIADLCKIRDDYFPTNFKAIFSGTGEHMSLKTEGGFPFILFLFSLINWELPFFVSAFFTFGFLIIISVIPWKSKKSKFVLSGFITLLVLLLMPKFAYSTLMLSPCLRDSSAHFFGLLGLLLCYIGINHRVGSYTLFFGSFCIGIAAWCRVPNILFFIPAGVYLLLSLKDLWAKQFIKATLLMIAGLIVGTLPLFGQNILEGRPFYAAGQMDVLVLNRPAETTNKNVVQQDVSDEQDEVTKLAVKKRSKKNFSAVKKGMSIQNFSSTSNRLYKYIQGMFVNKFVFWLFILSSVIAVIINYRLSLSVLSGSLVFFLFYSCYDKVVGRYAVIVPLILLPLVVLCLGQFIDLILKLVKNQKRKLMITRFLAVAMTLACLILMGGYGKSLGSLLQERKYCLEYKKNIEKVIHNNDSYICFNTIINSWTQYFSGAERFHWLLSVADHWDIYADKDAQFSKFDDIVKSGKNVFYIEMQATDMPFKYWSKQDVNLHYEVQQVDEIGPMFTEHGTVIVSEVTDRNSNQRIIKYSKTSQDSKLLVWTADTSGVVPDSQDVIFEVGELSFTNKLIKGINIFDVPSGFYEQSSEIKMNSTTNLPIVIDAIAFSTNVTIVFQSYEDMPASLLTLSGSKPFWHGKYRWGRESRPEGGKYVDPLIALPGLTGFNVLNGEDMKMTLRFATIGKMRSKGLRDNLSEIILKSEDNNYPMHLDIVSWSQRGARRIIVADLSTDLLNFQNDLNTFQIDINSADKASIFLESISFSF